MLISHIEDHEFGLLVSNGARQGDNPELIASQIPFLVARSDRGLLLQGHIARANPQAADLDHGAEVLAIFPGPHAYISPSWYAAGPAVPTWNYASVHAYGTARAIGDREWLRDLVDRLSQRHEAREAAPWRMRDLPAAYLESMLGGIVGDRDRRQPSRRKIQAEPEPAGRRPAAHHRRARTACGRGLARGRGPDAPARSRGGVTAMEPHHPQEIGVAAGRNLYAVDGAAGGRAGVGTDRRAGCSRDGRVRADAPRRPADRRAVRRRAASAAANAAGRHGARRAGQAASGARGGAARWRRPCRAARRAGRLRRPRDPAAPRGGGRCAARDRLHAGRAALGGLGARSDQRPGGSRQMARCEPCVPGRVRRRRSWRSGCRGVCWPGSAGTRRRRTRMAARDSCCFCSPSFSRRCLLLRSRSARWPRARSCCRLTSPGPKRSG